MDRASKPGSSRMSDEDLLLQHGIDKECRVVLPVLEESLSEVCLLSEGLSRPVKEFRVHYGRHYLWQLAEELAFRYEVQLIDLDQVYNTFIPSQYSSMDRASFKSILLMYVQWWEKEFRQRRNDLYEKALQAWKDKLERNRLVKLTYHDEQILCRKWNKEETKIAWKGGTRSKVVLQRIFVTETPVSASNFEARLAAGQNDAPVPVDVAPAPVGIAPPVDIAPAPVDIAPPVDIVQAPVDIAPPHDIVPAPVDIAPSDDIAPAPVDIAPTSVNVAPMSVDTALETMDADDSSELPGPSTSRDAMSTDDAVPFFFRYGGNESVQDRWTAIDGAIRDIMTKISEEQDPGGDGGSNQDMSSTDCYSEDTVESPMEVEFESGESPDFSKALRDSDETCHGDEFFNVSRAQQQGLPNGNAGSSDVIQKASGRSPDKSMVVKPAKL